MRFDDKTDHQVEEWARKFEIAGLADDPRYKMLLQERSRRRQARQVLDFSKSLGHLKDCAISQRFTSYAELAEASGVQWSKARHQMNGAKGHLDTLTDVCRINELPLLTAICVNKQNLETGTLGDDALIGFVQCAKRLGMKVDEATEFHQRCVEECFAWGRQQ